MKAAGLTVTRIAGADRFKTDAQVIAQGGTAKRNVAVVATGFNFPDALAGGPLAYTGSPLALEHQGQHGPGHGLTPSRLLASPTPSSSVAPTP